jgi:hypothetical protein
MLLFKICKHSFQGTVVTEVALAKETEETYPWRSLRRAAAASGLAK